MYVLIRRIARELFKTLNLGLVRYDKLIKLEQTFIDHICLTNKYNFYKVFESKLKESQYSSKPYREDLDLLRNSKSQYGQDLFALMCNNFKTGGSFIEFGAYDGITFSNTHLLEYSYGWKGILIDPVPAHYKKMESNRRCQLINAAITPYSETEVLIEEAAASDLSKLVPKKSLLKKVHKVKAITLSDVIEKYLKSSALDFLSIDIEEKDFEVLTSIDFDKIQINAICVEHNNREDSESIISFMNDKGFDLMFSEYSTNDYWFRYNSVGS